MSSRARDLLRTHTLRLTEARLDVLDFIIDRQRAVSQPELEHALVHKFDRVTLYRTLNTFNENGLLHAVSDSSGTMKYALCSDSCSNEEHHHEHLHFHCTACHQTVCIDEVMMEQPKLPAGYVANDYNFVVNGICKQCNA